MAEQKSLQDLLVEELRDAYDAEKQLVKALGKLSKAAQAEPLRAAFLEHQTQTQGHADRLEKVFELLDLRPRGKHCPGIAGIIEEGGNAIEELPKSAVRDAALIGGGQRAEHYEIAAYGTLVAFAQTLGLDQAAKIFQGILAEEEATDKKLTMLSRSINTAASQEMSEEEEEVDV
jgi:ferritin-like metal-binding protein YciE